MGRCQHCADYHCDASPFAPASSPDGDEVVWMLPDGADPASGAQGWKSMKVCPQNDGSANVLDYYGTAGKGCVTANALCCGGSETQCLVDQSDASKSQVGSITVPCGVNVTYSYEGTCNFDDTKTYQLTGDGVPKVLTCDTTTNTTCPYSYQFSLAPGYECLDGSVVLESNNAKPCQPGGGSPSFESGSGAAPVASGLSRTTVVVVIAVVGVLLLVLAYVAVNRKAHDVLSVKQIVARAGIDEHLVAPGSVKP